MMETQRILQVLSTFAASSIEPSLRQVLARARIADGVGFMPKAEMREYMLAPASDTEHVIGTVVLVRVEDWLPDGPASSVRDSGDLWPREELKTRVREFVSELTILSYRGKPVWFLVCPSSGGIAEESNLASLCRTYTNLLVSRVRNAPLVTPLNWPSALFQGGFNDRDANAFDRLGEFLGAEVMRTLASDSQATETAAGRSPELAAYLAGLQVQVELTPADSVTRSHVDRVLRTAASFSLTGEKPDMPDADIDAILKSEICKVVSVSDRLANHGPSGVVVGRWNENTLVVELLSLSCTVLGKQVEYALLSALAQIAVERHCSNLVFEYRPSGRNQPMLNFLQSVADAIDNHYVLALDQTEARINAAAVNPGAWSVSAQPEKTPSSER